MQMSLVLSKPQKRSFTFDATASYHSVRSQKLQLFPKKEKKAIDYVQDN